MEATLLSELSALYLVFICHDLLSVYRLDNGVTAPKACLIKWLLRWSLIAVLDRLERKFTLLFSQILPRNLLI